jgi:hypothetical protein
VPSQMPYQNAPNWYNNPSDGRFASNYICLIILLPHNPPHTFIP